MLLLSCKSNPTTVTANTSSIRSDTVQIKGADSWVSLFNGKDLSGWDVKIAGHSLNDNFGNTFRVQDGILSVRYDAYGSNFNNRFGALYYHKRLSNFRLRVEYRFVGETAPGAPSWGYRDSGVQFFCQSAASMNQNQLFPISLEFNLHGSNGTDERPLGEVCANGIFVEHDGKRNESYCTPPKLRRTFHGDQWVAIEIDVKNDIIRHFANGEEILTYNNPIYDEANPVVKTLIQTDDFRVREGFISLQSNSHPIDFRKIELLVY